MRSLVRPGAMPIRAYFNQNATPLPLAMGFMIAIGTSLLLWAMIAAAAVVIALK